MSTRLQPSPIPWSHHDGKLSLAKRWWLAIGAVRSRLAVRSGRRRMPTLGLDARALDTLTPPGDAGSRAVLRLAADLQPSWLLQHGLRTFAWSRLLALHGDFAHDAVSLYAASLLHDIGLTPTAAEPPNGCFAIRGAMTARRILVEAGADAERAHTVACAIALHLDLDVGPEQGIEAHLLNAGAALDVIGRRARELDRPLRQAVIERHPRLAMKRELCACMRREATAAPDTRIGLYSRRFGFLDLIEKAPFDD
jgi:hypothetical protein